MPVSIPALGTSKLVGSDTVITSITGGDSFDFEVTLNSPTASALDVTLSVNDASLLNGSWPMTMTVPANATSAHVTISTRASNSSASVVLTATANGGSTSSTLILASQDVAQ